MENLVRLNKFIASNGISSRRKVDEFITQGRVTVNGNTVTELGYRINPETDRIQLDGENVRASTKKIYIILNKPAGIITSVSDEKKRTTVIDLLNLHEKVFPVGRLDYNTTGLLLLTNDGELAHQLMHPKGEIYKTYFVKLSKPLEEKHRLKLTEGVKLDGKDTAPCRIRYPKKNNNYQDLYISIYEGRNRQVRNMFEHYGYFVRELERVEYAGLKIDNLRSGEWRKLTADEVNRLKEIVKDIPAGPSKRIHYAKRSVKREFNKYSAAAEKKDFKNDFIKPGKNISKKDTKFGFKKRLITERDNRLGFRKIEDDERNDLQRNFKKTGNGSDNKFEKRDFKKSGNSFEKSGSKKFEKRDFKKSGNSFEKSGSKKFEKRDFKKSGNSFEKSGSKKFEKRDFKKSGNSFEKSDSKKIEKRNFKKSFVKRDEKESGKKDFRKINNISTGKSAGKKFLKKDFKRRFTKKH